MGGGKPTIRIYRERERERERASLAKMLAYCEVVCDIGLSKMRQHCHATAYHITVRTWHCHDHERLHQPQFDTSKWLYSIDYIYSPRTYNYSVFWTHCIRSLGLKLLIFSRYTDLPELHHTYVCFPRPSLEHLITIPSISTCVWYSIEIFHFKTSFVNCFPGAGAGAGAGPFRSGVSFLAFNSEKMKTLKV